MAEEAALTQDAPEAEAALGAESQAEERQLTDVQKLAAELGWKPEGIPGKPQKTAEEWLKAGRDIERGLKDDVRNLKRTIDGMAAAGAKQTERALRKQAEEIEERFAEAVANKDTKGAAAAARDMRELEQESRPEQSRSAEDDFAAKHSWYGPKGDEDATAYAISVAQREHAKGRSTEDQLEAAESAVRKRFPELFDSKPQRKPAQVAEPTGRSQHQSRSKGFDDLPDAVKNAANEYVKMFERKGMKVDAAKARKQYADDYFASQA